MQVKDKKGLILAAGYGSRLDGISESTAFKPLTPVAGIPLIFRTISSLERAGCSGIVIVLGHGHREVKKEILSFYKGKVPLEFIYNAKYHLRNGVSVLSAKEVLTEEFIMTMADHVLGDSLMQIAKEYSPTPGSAALLVDYKIDSVFDMDDATKVYSENNIIRSIGKQIEDYNCIDTGVFICTSGLLDALSDVYKETGDASISDGVQKLASKGHMFTIDIEDGFWQDVDTPEMLNYVERVLSEN